MIPLVGLGFGGRDATEQGNEHSPQLCAYTRALEHAGKRVLEMWFCFPVSGGAVRVASTPAQAH